MNLKNAEFVSHFFCYFNQNKNMDWKISLYYLIPTFFILLLVFPVFVEVRLSYNPLYNRGVVALTVLKKQIFYYIFSFHGKFIELENESETKLQKLEFESQEFALMEEFGNQIKDKIRLKKCYMFYNIGTGDAYTSALLCGFINFAVTQVFLFLKSKKPTASFCVYDTVSYNIVTCELAFVVSGSVSFFDIVYSFIYSVIISKRKK